MNKLIKELSETFGPSGEENLVRDLIIREIKRHVDEIQVDGMGNLIALKRSRAKGEGGRSRSVKTGNKIMFAAHMDEIGLIVTHIDEKGFLRIAPVGGVNPVQLVGQLFKLSDGSMGTVYHEKIKDIKEIGWPKLYMDIGASDRNDAQKKAGVGSMVVYGQHFSHAGDCYMGKAMDNRIGCFVLIEAIKKLAAKSINDLYFAFTVQEEVGLRGARGAAYGINPDYAVAVDVTRSGDTPEAPLMEISLGKGPAVKVMDSSIISHKGVRNFMINVAEKKGLPYQLEVLERGGTDAGVIHLSRSGVPSGVLSIPCRYVHSSSEMVNIEDVNIAIKYILELCKSDNWAEIVRKKQ